MGYITQKLNTVDSNADAALKQLKNGLVAKIEAVSERVTSAQL